MKQSQKQSMKTKGADGLKRQWVEVFNPTDGMNAEAVLAALQDAIEHQVLAFNGTQFQLSNVVGFVLEAQAGEGNDGVQALIEFLETEQCELVAELCARGAVRFSWFGTKGTGSSDLQVKGLSANPR